MRPLLLSLAALCSCTSFELVRVPDDGTVEASIVAWVAPGETGQAAAFDGRSYHVAVPGEDETVAVLHYDAPLASYQLQPGPLPSAVDGRLLPFERGFVRRGGDFEELFALPPELTAFRIARFDPSRCYALDGCVLGRDRCTGCPESTVETPLVPLPPTAPAAPDLSCPAGWIGDAEVGCRPGDPVRVVCGDGQLQRFGDASCTPIGAGCPDGDGFPDGVPGAAIYVQPGGSGAGTRAAPLGLIEEALAVAPAGATIVLSIGIHTSGALTLPGSITLYGACSDTVLRAPQIATDGEGVGLFDLTVETDELEVRHADARLSSVVFTGTATTSIRIALGGDAAIDRVVLRSGAFQVEVEVDAKLEAFELIADGADCTGLSVLGELLLQNGVLAAPPCGRRGAQLYLEGGWAALDSVRLRGGIVAAESRLAADDLVLAGGGLELQGGSGSFRGLAVSGSPAAAVRAVDVDLSLQSASLLGATVGIELLGVETSSLARVFVAPSPEGIGLSAGAGAAVNARDLVVRGGSIAVAVDVANLELDRASVANATVGIELRSGTMLLRDLDLSRVGTGVAVDEGSDVIVERVRVQRAMVGLTLGLDAIPILELPCVVAAGSLRALRLADVSISSVGRSIETSAETVTMNRIAVDRVDAGPLLCLPATVVVADLVVSQVAERALHVVRGGSVVLDRVQLSASRFGALFEQADRVDMRDVRIADAGSGGLSIDGLNLGGTVTLARVDVEATADGALAVRDLNATLSHVAVRNVPRGPCLTITGGQATLDAFHLDGCETQGLLLRRTLMQLTNGLVERVEEGVGTDAEETVTMSGVFFRDAVETVHVAAE